MPAKGGRLIRLGGTHDLSFVAKIPAHLLWILAYTSPFAIQTSADASWLTDIPARRQLIVAESSPPPADWYSTSYGPQSYGPKNPQLYSVNKAQLGAPDLVKALQSDRGAPVEEVLINTPPEGVASTTWSIQRLLSIAQQLIGTPYQHLHLPTFNPALVTTPGCFTWRTSLVHKTILIAPTMGCHRRE